MKTVVNTSDNTNSTKNTNSPNTQQFLMMPYELLSVHEVNGQRFDINMKVAYQYIKGFQDNGQQAYFSRAKLGEMLDIKELAVTRMMNKMIDCGLVNRIERSGYTNLYTVNPIEQNDTAAKSVAEEVKNESGPTVGNKAQSVKPSNSPTESAPEDLHHNNSIGIGDSDSAEPVNAAQPTQLPPVIFEEQLAQPEQPAEAEEEEEEPDFNAYAAMAAPIALSGWVTTHNATVELKAAYEAHRNAHHAPRYVPHPAAHHTPEYDGMEAF
ncbi:hypothetical protein ACUNI2_20845 [Serratia sp. IR-2025]|uniref:hypothetical protein n=1 Tax=Serratia surfactantfaciens TaxID=2741499 RepID=UPI001B3C7DF1|nr:hypothetical protein [Serratia surfactantfaciens]